MSWATRFIRTIRSLIRRVTNRPLDTQVDWISPTQNWTIHNARERQEDQYSVSTNDNSDTTPSSDRDISSMVNRILNERTIQHNIGEEQNGDRDCSIINFKTKIENERDKYNRNSPTLEI